MMRNTVHHLSDYLREGGEKELCFLLCFRRLFNRLHLGVCDLLNGLLFTFDGLGFVVPAGLGGLLHRLWICLRFDRTRRRRLSGNRPIHSDSRRNC